MREAYEPVAGQGISDSDVPDQEVVHGRPCERDVVADEERRFLGRRTRQPGYVPFRQVTALAPVMVPSEVPAKWV